jgi:predicted O-methyltransferase YrrM
LNKEGTTSAADFASLPERKSLRYSQLTILIALVQPRTIIEVGTNRGDSAVAMCLEALKHRCNVHYTGFDVFDTRDENFHRNAFNGKRAFSKQSVHDRLELVRAQFPSFTFELIEGETSTTLHHRSMRADFVFIDGDHRIEAIRRDYAALSKSNVIVFDDFFDASAAPGNALTRSYGCNDLVAALAGVTVLPLTDNFPITGPIRMAVKIRKSPFAGWFRPLSATLRSSE